MHEFALILGSNIQPQRNLIRALMLLGLRVEVTRTSSIWQTEAVGGGPDFWNQAVCLRTDLEAETLKWQVLRDIEDQLGRVRAADKNAPRTIDLDIILVDGVVVDASLWERAYIAAPFAELCGDLLHPVTGRPLREISRQLGQRTTVRRLPRPDCS